MKERPILFSGPMVRALLSGTKTQTRRVVNPKMYLEMDDHVGDQCHDEFGAHVLKYVSCPYGAPGDRLWVRETWALMNRERTTVVLRGHHLEHERGAMEAAYRSTEDHDHRGWRPCIHMPRWASRITLEVTEVRVQRLQDISEEDARAEGARYTEYGKNEHTISADGGKTWGKTYTQRPGWSMVPTTSHEQCLGTPRFAFANLWNNLHGADAWDVNPWVWAISFRLVQP